MTNSKSPQTFPTSDEPAFNIADQTYLNYLKEIHEKGNLESNSRTGVGTKSLFCRELRFNMFTGRIPLITTRKMFTKAAIYELLWFIGNHLNDPKYRKFSRMNAKYLIDNGVNIWVGDLHKAYLKEIKKLTIDQEMNEKYGYMSTVKLNWSTGENCEPLTKEQFIERIKSDDEFADIFGECGPIYGEQWRDWKVPGQLGSIDQLNEAILKLKSNPTDRRIMVSAWNVADIEKGDMVLPPCHYSFTFYSRLLTLEERIYFASDEPQFDPLEFGIGPQVTDESIHQVCDAYEVPRRALSLKWNQRSVDSCAGLPTNILSYALLLRMVAKEVKQVPDELIGSLENCHYYLNQLDAVKELLSRKVLRASPTLWLNPEKSIFEYDPSDIKIIGYESQSKIEIPVSF